MFKIGDRVKIKKHYKALPIGNVLTVQLGIQKGVLKLQTIYEVAAILPLEGTGIKLSYNKNSLWWVSKDCLELVDAKPKRNLPEWF